MKLRRRVQGGAMAVIGFLLSPLSWWNDLFVNVPLALAFAWVASYFYPPAFAACFVIGYWLTNVLGFVLMHKGGARLITGEVQTYTRRMLLRDVVISLAYTLVILLLVVWGAIKPLPEYLTR